MATFAYKGIDGRKSSVSGTLEAPDRRSASRKLAAKQIKPVSLVEQKNKPKPKAKNAAKAQQIVKEKQRQEKQASGKRRFSFTSKTKHALAFLERLLEFLECGMPLGDAVRLLSHRINDPQQKEIGMQLWKDLSEGRTLAAAMAEMPDVFPPSTTYLIEAGEETGNLVPVVKRLVDYMRESAELKSRLIASTAYPVFIVVAGIGVGILFVYFLLPKIKAMIDKMQGEMNFLAEALIASSDLAVKVLPFAAIGGLLLAIFLYQYRRSPKGREFTDGLMIKLPLVGKVAYYAQIVQVSQLMGTLMESGVNTTETLRLSEKAIDNVPMRARFATARSQIQEGMSISGALKQNEFLPDTASDILTVGENTGNLVNSLNNISRIYLKHLNNRMSFLITSITVGALSTAFIMVLAVALVIITSVFEVQNSIR